MLKWLQKLISGAPKSESSPAPQSGESRSVPPSPRIDTNESTIGTRSGEGPDYSGIVSRAQAEQLFADGKLAKLYLFPLEFGGPEGAGNVIYVPEFVVELKRSIDMNIVRPLIDEGKVTKYSASPTYEGISFVPTSITIQATDPSQFSTVIGIWGNALRKGSSAV